jgi:hypothetical protein
MRGGILERKIKKTSRKPEEYLIWQRRSTTSGVFAERIFSSQDST